MRWGAIYSGLLHLAIVLLALGVLPHVTPPMSEIPPAIPVELVRIDKETNIKKMVKAEEEPKPEPEKPAEPEPQPQVQASLPPPPEPEPIKPPDIAPPPEPVPDIKLPEPMPVPEVNIEEPKPAEVTPPNPETADARPRQKPKPPAPKSKTSQMDKLAALLNKLPTKEQQTEGDEAAPTDPENVKGVGQQTELTMTEMDALRNQMKRCWSVPAGSANAAALIVSVRIWLNPDGSLQREPAIVDMGALAGGDPAYRVAAEAALRAVRMCQPYQLPVEKYSSWREIEMRFDPRDMLGG